jgi:hypothetical protein
MKPYQAHAHRPSQGPQPRNVGRRLRGLICADAHHFLRHGVERLLGFHFAPDVDAHADGDERGSLHGKE